MDPGPHNDRRDAVRRALGRRRPAAICRRLALLCAATAAGVALVTVAAVASDGVARATGLAPEPSTAASETATPTPTPSGTPDVWPATADDPVRLWVGGDSLAGQLRWGIEPLLDEAGVFEAFFFHKTSSGICRYDFYNWRRKTESVMARTGPDALVMMVGANDAQSVWYAGRWIPYGTAAWKDVYRSRAGRLMDIMLEGGARRVYWVGAPIMKQKWRSARMKTVNAIFLQQVRLRPGVKYVGIWRLFTDEEGRYVARWRRSDGVHFSPAGWRRLARYVYRRIKADWLPAVTPTPTPSPSPTASESASPSPSPSSSG